MKIVCRIRPGVTRLSVKILARQWRETSLTLVPMKQKTLALGLIPAWLAWAVCATAQAGAATYVVDKKATAAADVNTGTDSK